MGALVAGAKYGSEFEERLKAVLERRSASPRNQIVTFIDEMHTVVGAGRRRAHWRRKHAQPMLAPVSSA